MRSNGSCSLIITSRLSVGVDANLRRDAVLFASLIQADPATFLFKVSARMDFIDSSQSCKAFLGLGGQCCG